MTENTKKKMQSRRFWFTAWAAISASAVMFFSIYQQFDASWMPGTLALLVGCVTAYITFSTLKKKKDE